jgi:hypothetical protein
MPLLEHERLGALAGRTITLEAGMRLAFGLGELGAHIVARGEQRTDTAEDHDPDLVVLLGRTEGVIEVDQHSPVLGIARVRPVQQDPDDSAPFEDLVHHELVLRYT